MPWNFCFTFQGICTIRCSLLSGIQVVCSVTALSASLQEPEPTSRYFLFRKVCLAILSVNHTSASYQIVRLQICPADDTRLVTCGKDNIRFWRVRSGQLRSCPVALSDHKIGEVTDVTFETSGKGGRYGIIMRFVGVMTGPTPILCN